MDPSWCPGCDKLILPKRYIVPLNPTPSSPPAPPQSETSPADDPEHDPNHPPPPPAPTPVPSSPEVRKKPLPDPTRPSARHGATRTRMYGLGGGLVHGTGRVRPGGGLKPRPAPPAEPKKPAVSLPKPPCHAPDVVPGNPTAARIATADPYFPLPPTQPSSSTPGKKTRVVISQEPTPLYCSDECRARDLKNSFLDSDSSSFSGAPAAVHHAAQLERVEQTVEAVMKTRRASASLLRPAPQPLSCGTAFSLPNLPRVQRLAEEPTLPPVPPNTYVEAPRLSRTISSSSTSSTSTASLSRLPHVESKNSTIRASQPRTRPGLPIRPHSFSAWGSPSKSAVAPPTQTLFTAGSSSSVGSSICSLSAGSALFDDDAIKPGDGRDDDDSSATTPSRRGSGSSGASKKEKRVSFAGDIKVPDEIKPLEDWCGGRRRRNPILDANPLRDAVSLSPRDRVKAASLPSDLLPPSPGLRPSQQSSQSSPSLVVDTLSSNRYGVAMWPEDEKRTTESTRVHGTLLRGYARRFQPREGRSLVWGRLWEGPKEPKRVGVVPVSVHEAQPDSRREYWRAFEEREAEARARRKAAVEVQREEEEKVICELLGGVGMKEEDQPQARRMKQMAYDGMPGPAELRGLTYRFDRFLYPLLQPKPIIVEKTVRRWDEERNEWIEETTCEEVYQERKKLFNFVED